MRLLLRAASTGNNLTTLFMNMVNIRGNATIQIIAWRLSRLVE